jgi:hypothetical protein
MVLHIPRPPFSGTEARNFSEVELRQEVVPSQAQAEGFIPLRTLWEK